MPAAPNEAWPDRAGLTVVSVGLPPGPQIRKASRSQLSKLSSGPARTLSQRLKVPTALQASRNRTGTPSKSTQRQLPEERAQLLRMRGVMRRGLGLLLSVPFPHQDVWLPVRMASFPAAWPPSWRQQPPFPILTYQSPQGLDPGMAKVASPCLMFYWLVGDRDAL